MRIFLDANILFSASLPDSKMRGFIFILTKHAECLTNSYAAEEARVNLKTKYPDSLKRLESLLKNCGLVSSIVLLEEDIVAQKDIPILGGAIAGKATYLLTGDKRDFGDLWGKKIQGVRIVSPALLAEELAWLKKDDS